jgi:hypothetical protein
VSTRERIIRHTPQEQQLAIMSSSALGSKFGELDHHDERYATRGTLRYEDIGLGPEIEDEEVGVTGEAFHRG